MVFTASNSISSGAFCSDIQQYIWAAQLRNSTTAMGITFICVHLHLAVISGQGIPYWTKWLQTEGSVLLQSSSTQLRLRVTLAATKPQTQSAADTQAEGHTDSYKAPNTGCSIFDLVLIILPSNFFSFKISICDLAEKQAFDHFSGIYTNHTILIQPGLLYLSFFFFLCLLAAL